MVVATSRALSITVGHVSSVSVTSMPVEVKDEPEKRRDSTKEVWKLSRSSIEIILLVVPVTTLITYGAPERKNRFTHLRTLRYLNNLCMICSQSYCHDVDNAAVTKLIRRS